MSKRLQLCFKSERKLRAQFNKKYCIYLPVSIQDDLCTPPVDLHWSASYDELKDSYGIINKIEISPQEVSRALRDIA